MNFDEFCICAWQSDLLEQAAKELFHPSAMCSWPQQLNVQNVNLCNRSDVHILCCFRLTAHFTKGVFCAYFMLCAYGSIWYLRISSAEHFSSKVQKFNCSVVIKGLGGKARKTTKYTKYLGSQRRCLAFLHVHPILVASFRIIQRWLIYWYDQSHHYQSWDLFIFFTVDFLVVSQSFGWHPLESFQLFASKTTAQSKGLWLLWGFNNLSRSKRYQKWFVVSLKKDSMEKHHEYSGTNGKCLVFCFKRILFITATWSARRMRCFWCHGDDLRSASTQLPTFSPLRAPRNFRHLDISIFQALAICINLKCRRPLESYQNCYRIDVYSWSRWLWHHSSATSLMAQLQCVGS